MLQTHIHTSASFKATFSLGSRRACSTKKRKEKNKERLTYVSWEGDPGFTLTDLIINWIKHCFSFTKYNAASCLKNGHLSCSISPCSTELKAVWKACVLHSISDVDKAIWHATNLDQCPPLRHYTHAVERNEKKRCNISPKTKKSHCSDLLIIHDESVVVVSAIFQSERQCRGVFTSQTHTQPHRVLIKNVCTCPMCYS